MILVHPLLDRPVSRQVLSGQPGSLRQRFAPHATTNQDGFICIPSYQMLHHAGSGTTTATALRMPDEDAVWGTYFPSWWRQPINEICWRRLKLVDDGTSLSVLSGAEIILGPSLPTMVPWRHKQKVGLYRCRDILFKWQIIRSVLNTFALACQAFIDLKDTNNRGAPEPFPKIHKIRCSFKRYDQRGAGCFGFQRSKKRCWCRFLRSQKRCSRFHPLWREPG